MRLSNSARPWSVAAAAAVGAIPSRRAARHTRAESPVGSAAASSSSRRVWPGRASVRRWKSASTVLATAVPRGIAKPPASSAAVRPLGSSSRANGLPRVSVTIWSRTRSSNDPVLTESSSSRAAGSSSPLTSSCGSLWRSSSSARAAKIRPSDSAPSRRATKARTCRDAWSSHWWSSMRHTNGRSSATSDSRPNVASPTRKRSGAGPPATPNTVARASRWGSGSRSRCSSIGAHSC